MHFRFIDRDDNDDGAITPVRPGAISICDRSRAISARSQDNRAERRDNKRDGRVTVAPLSFFFRFPSPHLSVLLSLFISLYLFALYLPALSSRFAFTPFLYLIPFGYLSISLSVP
jgi:hypothetical protein